MKKSSTDSFCLNLPLRYELWQRGQLDKTFKAAGNICNCLIADRKKALEQMERTREWRRIQNGIKTFYGDTAKKAELKELYDQKKKLMAEYGMSEYAFQARAQKWRATYKKMIGTHVLQKIASSVWKMFEAYFYGNGEQISFKPYAEFLSIEGKTDTTNIRYKDNTVYIGTMAICVVAPRNDYEREALSNRVKYCRIVRLPWKDGWLYKLQLVLEGKPPIKHKPETGEVVHALGKGRVGIDPGTQTMAVVGEKQLSLNVLAPAADPMWSKLRRINRAMDRSRRATNPQFFQPNGEIIKKNYLSKELLDKRGRRRWVESKRYKKLKQLRRYLLAKIARARKCQHNELANKLLSYGDTFFVEKMDYQALAKRAKKQDPKEMKPGEQYKRRKRFGKSVANKAPAAFLRILEKKVAAQGGQLLYVDTWKARASQYNHIDQTYRKKKLAERMTTLPDGNRVQRDLYSGFLLRNSNDTLDGFNQALCEETFEQFMIPLDAELQRLSHIHTPSSTGVRYAA